MSNIPADLRYVASHEWIRLEADGSVTVGITDHAQEALGDVVYVELPEVGKQLASGQEAGVVESVKAASDIYAPISGEVLSVNEALADAPEQVNGEPYAAWFFKLQPSNPAELEALVNQHDIGVIKMEVSRNHGPQDGFLHKVRDLATARGIVLIFDECTSGFRQSFGGLHKLYGVEPDMAMFGKALGNGYAITAIIGRREVMEAAQSTFISSTFWTERIGPSAALKTLEVMERMQSWETITHTGLKIREGWQSLADKHSLEIEHWGLPALTGFTFRSRQALAYKTLITQEMLSKGYLAGNSVYVCTEHTPEILQGFFDALDPVFGLIKACENGRDVISLLKGPVCHGGFKRLN